MDFQAFESTKFESGRKPRDLSSHDRHVINHGSTSWPERGVKSAITFVAEVLLRFFKICNNTQWGGGNNGNNHNSST